MPAAVAAVGQVNIAQNIGSAAGSYTKHTLYLQRRQPRPSTVSESEPTTPKRARSRKAAPVEASPAPKPKRVRAKKGATGPVEVEMITPKHGGGQLQKGNPGNKGGTGRPPSEVRALAGEAAYLTVPVIAEIATGFRPIKDASGEVVAYVPVKPEAAIAAWDKLMKYSMGSAKGLDKETVRAGVRQTIDAVTEVLGHGTPQHIAILSRMREIWSEIG